MLRGFATVMSKGFRFAGKKPPVSPAGIDFLARTGRYSIAKARRVLGYEPRITLDEGMQEIARRLS